MSRGQRFKERTEFRGAAKIGEIGILAEKLKVMVAQLEAPLDGTERLLNTIHERVAAGEVIPGQRIAAAQFGEAHIDRQPLVMVPAPGVGIGEGNEDVDEVGVGADKPLVEDNFKVEQFNRFSASRHQ